MSVLLLLYLYNAAVMLVLSWNLTKLGRAVSYRTETSYTFIFLNFFFLDMLSATVGSLGHGEALRDSAKEHQSV